jgi:iron complex transport system permease protein
MKIRIIKKYVYNSSFSLLLLLLLLCIILSTRYGAVNISIDEMFQALKKLSTGNDDLSLNERIFMGIRLPRALLCVVVGASLATGGTLMQALFRNPIVEPGLVGTSSGAAFGAALYFVLGGTWGFHVGEWTLPLAATLGAFAATALVFVLSSSKNTGRNSVISLLLTGIAINALFMSGVGFLSYTARDPQARSITFWNLGTLSGASWKSLLICTTVTFSCILWSLRYAKQLNSLMLGEEEAQYLGVNTRRLRLQILTLNVIMVATSTAFVGVIGFVGLIVPHLLRMIFGADNRLLIRNSALLGGILLSLADLTARMLLRPAELPIGIVLSIIGVPVFIMLLRRNTYYF